MPIIYWVLYGDLKLDPICRSVTLGMLIALIFLRRQENFTVLFAQINKDF